MKLLRLASFRRFSTSCLLNKQRFPSSFDRHKAHPNKFIRHQNNQKNDRHIRKNNGSPDRDEHDIIFRNKMSRTGKEGDGLRGLDDYEVDITKLRNIEWTDLIPVSETESSASSEISSTHFSPVPTLALADHKLISRVLVNSLNYNRKYTSLTPVQAQTLIPILRNQSVVVRAKTGTGKTAAFSIPTIQKVLEAKRRNESGVKALIISPTRELAQQIADEITAITAYGELRSIKTQCFVGGLSKNHQLRLAFKQKPCVDIVIATPGRLNDILQNDSDLVLEQFANLRFKVLDEADRLLDIGFRKELDEIRDRLAEVIPDGQVPTLLFSATTDQSVRSFARDEFGGRVKVIDTVPKNEPTAAELVSQRAIQCPNWAVMYEAGLQSIAEECSANDNFKAIVFLPSVKMVENFALFLKKLFRVSSTNDPRVVHTLHGQMTQAKRQKASDAFRNADKSILITTDVVARGMDFPGVSHVFQVGVPHDVSQYIHRIGRTARIGKSGKSVLILSRYELPFLTQLKDQQNVVLHPEIYKSDEQFHNTVIDLGPDSVVDDDEANILYNNVLITMGGLKRAFKIDASRFLRDHEAFGQLFGLESPQLEGVVRRSWAAKPHMYGKMGGRGSFNNTGRKSRMKW